MVTKKLTDEEKAQRKQERIDKRHRMQEGKEKESEICGTCRRNIAVYVDGRKECDCGITEAPIKEDEIPDVESCDKPRAKKLPMVVNTKRFTVREVKVDLQDKEINEAGIELAHKQKQYAEIEEEMKGHMSNYKDRLKEVATQMNTLGNKVTLKYEYRKFSCEIWLNFKTKERVYKDRETHKVIDTVGLEADDYQLRLAV